MTSKVSTRWPGASPPVPVTRPDRSVSSSQLDLSWTDNAKNEIFFQLQSANNPLFTQAATRGIPPNTTSYSDDTGLGPIETYWYRIKTTGPGGSVSAWSNPAFATTAPNATATPTVVLTSDGHQAVSRAVDVNWTPPSAPNTNITGYTVRS